MTDRYVGIGGNDGNDGLSWANRKLTLNGVEDTPVAAGDTVYVGPGVHRVATANGWRIDVAGTSGSPITFIGDVTGENTDGVGGLVRITASDTDTGNTHTQCILSNGGENYRTFRGFYFDGGTARVMRIDNATNWIIEDCVFHCAPLGISTDNAQDDHIIRRCMFFGRAGAANINFQDGSVQDDTGILVENCLFFGHSSTAVRIDRIGGGTFKNCTFFGTDVCIDVQTALTGGQKWDVNNCIFEHNDKALDAINVGEIVENYNVFWSVVTERTNVSVGGNSVSQMVIPQMPILKDGFVFPWHMGMLSEWDKNSRVAGTGEATDDLFGVVRPTTSAKKSWGAFQLREAERETGTVQTGSAALTLADAGDHQIFVPTTATSTTFKVAARYESEYAGTLPQLIVRQPGQADSTDTMVAAADTWEDLSITLTPDANPPYVIMILRSLNTSVTGDFDTYWDDLDVS